VLLAGLGVVLLLAALGIQWFLGAAAQRAAIIEVLDRTPTAQLHSAQSFEARIDSLIGVRDEARRFDARTLRRWTLGRVTDSWEKSCEELAIRLREVIEAEMTEARDEGTEFQHQEWSRLVIHESRLCPWFEHNRDLRERGSITLELRDRENVEVVLYRQNSVPGPHEDVLTFFRKIGPVIRPKAGSYRYVVRERGSRDPPVEIPFLAREEWGPAQSLRIVEHPPELQARMIRIPRGYLPLRIGPPEQMMPTTTRPEEGPMLVIPAIYLSTPVTKADFERFLAETCGDRSTMLRPDAPDAEPVGVPSTEAFEFARWAGGRLPSLLELTLAERTGLIELDLVPRTVGDQEEDDQEDAASSGGPPSIEFVLCGEWICDREVKLGGGVAQDLAVNYLDYRWLSDQDTLPFSAYKPTEPGGERDLRSSFGRDTPAYGGLGFRVVFPADEPGILEHVLQPGD